MLTFTNDFHGTEVSIRPGANGTLSAHQIRRMQAVLCGIANCQCADATGVRGPQNHGYVLVPVDQQTYRVEQRSSTAAAYHAAYLAGETLDSTQVAAQLDDVTPQWVSRIAQAEGIGHKTGTGRTAPRLYLRTDVERIRQSIADRQAAKREHAAGLAARRQM